MNENLRRKELADFLKSRRKRLTPEEAGLSGTDNSRRRTKGLRREEVAVLAGISLPWYTALEQGRDIRVSDSVIDSLARTLKLDRDERVHLYMLADRKVPLNPIADGEYWEKANPELQRIVDQYTHLPAYAIDGQWNLLVWNQTAAELFGLYPSRMRDCARNLLWLLFTDPVFRGRFANWETSAGKLLAAFRTAYARRMEDPCLSEIIGSLAEAADDFNAIWERHDVQCLRDNLFQIQHPHVGAIDILSNAFYAAEHDDITLVLYTPANVIDEERLKHLKNRSKQMLAEAVSLRA
ncbi:helix-turn-helix transcriptional regulator [Fictibacillus sp. WQ 8-8]|uniref:helix-turn-helix transcriptional regulator n=1 Tax=Fictibacillus sp. WQ 8-8 TaxID=2938788 RepID=UPI0021093A9C|nr:helix-turn-helix transcriptional regulator [Fictibacillus sp. WQ 8-8]MCQ6268673.1 helix-turn-helix transcriptional regulator [Fictibacillus sp. WQ 8-8]